MVKVALNRPPFLTHSICRYHPPGSFTDPSAESLSRERARERDRSRPHERRHHSSAGEKQRYYSCERYSSREQSHTKSAGPSRSTSPGESHDSVLLKQVRCLPFFAPWWIAACHLLLAALMHLYSETLIFKKKRKNVMTFSFNWSVSTFTHIRVNKLLLYFLCLFFLQHWDNLHQDGFDYYTGLFS